MTCKKHFSVALRVTFRVYMFEILSKTLSSIIHQGWEAVSLNLNLRSLESRHYCRCRCSRICCSHRSWCRHCRLSTTIDSLTTVDGLPLSMVSHHHSPPQPLSHKISLMQMGALNSYHISNLKFRYLKSNKFIYLKSNYALW